MKKALDDYKNLIGQTYNWLTITDIVRNQTDNRVWVNCICKCANTTSKALRKILSGHAKSCGCYNRSKEKGACHSQWYKDHPEKRDAMIQKVIQWRENNQDKCDAISNKVSKWYKDNPDKVKEKAEQFSKWCKDNPELVEKYTLLSKEKQRQRRLAFFDNVSIDELSFIHFNSNTYQNRACSRCSYEYSQSSYEQEIADYISTFYSGELVKNSREIISPLELDLYYPEKKIAIEFNGDYWHSSLFKEQDYHYNKFKSCVEVGVLLVSIFESDWNSRKEEIKQYLFDSFNCNENQLSYNRAGYINNNYPSPIHHYAGQLVSDYYIYKNYMVYTCGYTSIDD